MLKFPVNRRTWKGPFTTRTIYYRKFKDWTMDATLETIKRSKNKGTNKEKPMLQERSGAGEKPLVN